MKTTSEVEFEKFLAQNHLPFQKIEEGCSRRPDYLVEVGGRNVFFELKEIAEDENFRTGQYAVSSRTVGDHVRRRIMDARKQIQFGAKKGIPSVLLVYNNLDPMHSFGTEDLDFITAMYGEYTVAFNVKTNRLSDGFYGHDGKLRQDWNTSFSAVGRLRPTTDGLEVTLFENSFSAIKLDYEHIPPCFKVTRIEVFP